MQTTRSDADAASIACAACGHDLAGLDAPTTCPECGARLDTPGGTLARPPLIRELGPAAWLGIAALALPLINSLVLFGTLSRSGPWLRDQAAVGAGIFFAGFLALTGLALLPTYALSGAGGWIFGLPLGSALAIGAIIGGSIIGYAIGRPAAADRLEAALRNRPKWLAVRDALVGHQDESGRLRGPGYLRTLAMVIAIRLPVNSPFALTNFVLAACRVPFSAYVVGTAIGIAPRTLAAVWIGSRIDAAFTTEALKENRPEWVFWLGIAISVLIVLVLGKIAWAAMERFTLAHQRGTSEDAPAAQPPDAGPQPGNGGSASNADHGGAHDSR